MSDFNLKNTKTLSRELYKSDFYRYIPSSLATVNNNNSNITINIPREDSYISLQNSYILIDFEVTRNDDTKYVDANEISLVNLGPVALFSEGKLTTHSGKHLENIENLHTVSLMHKLLSSSHDTNDILYGFDSNVARRRQELTNNKEPGEKGTFYNRIRLIDIFGFADQDKITYGLGYNLTLKRNSNNNIIHRIAAIAHAKVVIKDIAWYVEKFTPNLENQQLIADQLLSETPTELYYEERTVFRKKISNDGLWTFELGIESGKNIPSWVIIGFMADNKFDSQLHDNSVFDWLPISQAVCRIGSEKYPGDYINLNYPRNNFHEAYYQIENFFLKHTEDRTMKPFIGPNSFRRSYNLYVFDITNQKEHIAAQPIIVDFKFYNVRDVNVRDHTAFALVLTNRLISISSDGKRMFDII